MQAAIVSYRAFCKGCSHVLFSHEGEWVCLKKGKSVGPFERCGLWENKWRVK